MLSTERQRFPYDIHWLFKIKYPFRCAFLLWLCWDEFLDSIKGIVSFCINLRVFPSWQRTLRTAGLHIAELSEHQTRVKDGNAGEELDTYSPLRLSSMCSLGKLSVLKGLNFVDVDGLVISR